MRPTKPSRSPELTDPLQQKKRFQLTGKAQKGRNVCVCVCVCVCVTGMVILNYYIDMEKMHREPTSYFVGSRALSNLLCAEEEGGSKSF
jgi:hypothetical protein